MLIGVAEDHNLLIFGYGNISEFRKSGLICVYQQDQIRTSF